MYLWLPCVCFKDQLNPAEVYCRENIMDAYEVHKKIQEAIVAVEVYELQRSATYSLLWHTEIIKGLEELARQRQKFGSAGGAANQIKLSDV